VEAEKSNLVTPLGAMEIKLPKGTLRITGAVDLIALHAELECLASRVTSKNLSQSEHNCFCYPNSLEGEEVSAKLRHRN
jgi:hypothetical protein